MSEGRSGKKRKRHAVNGNPSASVDTSKPTALFKPQTGRDWTVSVALPGSIIGNAQSHDLKTALAGQIARALAVFCVDEIVIFDDGQPITSSEARLANLNDRQRQLAIESEAQGYTAFSDPCQFLYHLLSYLETPPYLRKELFAFHPNLRTAGSLPSLDMPHHLRAEEWCEYRDGVTVSSNASHSQHLEHGHGRDRQHRKTADTATNASTSVFTGLKNDVHLPASIPPKTRVTLQFENHKTMPPPSTPLQASPVSPDAPRTQGGYYWGYTVRSASSLEAVFTESPHDVGYDYCIGTSERGVALRELTAPGKSTPSWNHLLVCFGGVAGLEKAFENDAGLAAKGVEKVEDLFDSWVNLVQGQGSRTIRTEEAVWIGLMGLTDFVQQSHRGEA